MKLRLVLVCAVLTLVVSACGENKKEDSVAPASPKEDVAVTSDNAAKQILASMLGVPNKNCGAKQESCHDISTILANRHLVAFVRCDGATSLLADIQQPEERVVIVWTGVPKDVQATLGTGGMYSAVVYGPAVTVEYFQGSSAPKRITNGEFRKNLASLAPNAFAHLAHHEQGDCVKLK